jgi:glycerol-3-phosphate dehydrogenase (NAD+)
MQYDDGTGAITRLVGFDESELAGHQRGKAKAIAHLREMYPLETLVVVGDGVTELEAVQEAGGADLVIGFGGVAQREAVAAGADWCVLGFDALNAALKRHRVAMIGSGEVTVCSVCCLADHNPCA